MKLATVRIRNGKGKVLTVNEWEWARSLGTGKWAGWTLDGGFTHSEKGAEDYFKAVSPESFDGEITGSINDGEVIVDDKPEVFSIDVEAETVAEEPAKETDEEDTFTDRGGNVKPKRRRGRPRRST